MRLSIAHHNPRSANRRGQTLVIAVMVMFILALIAAIFIGVVARNLIRSARTSKADVVAQLAEAGIRYADMMLVSSEDGADWRPVPDNLGAADSWDPTSGAEPVGGPDWEYLRDNHPDFKWTRPYWPAELGAATPGILGFAGPTGGYTTFHTGEGRFLLRLSYNPDQDDPLSHYIKVQSIGRYGEVVAEDPTTLKPYGEVLLRREMTAYKPIGLTDYLRFITNKDKRPTYFALGVPGFDVYYGSRPIDDDSNPVDPQGVSLRVNGNVAFYGKTGIDICLRGMGLIDDEGNITDFRYPIDRVEIAGKVKVEDSASGVPVDVRIAAALPKEMQDGEITRWGVKEFGVSSGGVSSEVSDYGFFASTDNSTAVSTSSGQTKRIEPPLLDSPDLTNTTTRYRLLTLNSGDKINVPAFGTTVNIGRYGWGRGVYIDNIGDRQEESETLFGGYTLRADWLKPNNPMSPYWKGPYYVPPGVVIRLNSGDTDGDGQPDMTITRTDVGVTAGAQAVWYDAWGMPRPEWGNRVTMPYPDPVRGRDVNDGNGNVKHIDGNGVIYAEGNIRIRGMLPPGMQLTVVSNENIYIEGNLLKYHALDSGAWKADETCALALLARENVCVNTTQFFSADPDDWGSDAMDGTPPFHVIVGNTPESHFKCEFEFGPADSTSRWMFMRHAGQYGPAYINAWLNPTTVDWGVLALNQGFSDLPPHVWGIGDPNFDQPPGVGTGSSFIGQVFPLNASINAIPYTNPGMPNMLEIGLDQTTYTRNNYLMGGFAIQPMDIRIQGILYAQEGSFFVIPGNWFNPDPSGTVAVDSMFPEFGQPLDILVTVEGAISENITASAGDQADWMSKWADIPAAYGTSGTPTAHPGQGLQFVADDHMKWPLQDLAAAASGAIRTDPYGRALPAAPRLPVCRGLLYFGQTM